MSYKFKILIKGTDGGRAEYPFEAESFDEAEDQARELISSGECPYEDPDLAKGGHLVEIDGTWVDVVTYVRKAVMISPALAFHTLNDVMDDRSRLMEVPLPNS